MIHLALVSALRAVTGIGDVVGKNIFPNDVPENISPPFICYRKVPGRVEEGFYCNTHYDVFEIDVTAPAGMGAAKYRKAKELAELVDTALAGGFEHDGVCVYDVESDGGVDRMNHEVELQWITTKYVFTYDQ